MIEPQRLFVGMPVWYTPNLDEPSFRFPAVVETEPWQLGHGEWVAHLRDLPASYGEWRNCPGRTRVVAACMEALYPRDENVAFDGALYYDCNDSDVLEHESVEACLDEYFDSHMTREGNAEAQIRALCPITVNAFMRKEVDDSWLSWICDALAERVSETFDEEYGNPDGGSEWESDTVAGLAKKFKPIVAEFVAGNVTSWQCKQVASRTYDEDQAVAMMRQENPHWFEPFMSAQAAMGDRSERSTGNALEVSALRSLQRSVANPSMVEASETIKDEVQRVARRAVDTCTADAIEGVYEGSLEEEPP